MMVSSVLNKIFKNIYLIVIGKFFPAATLGYFKNAQNLSLMPTRTLSSAVKSVTFPAFSEIQDDNKRLKKGYKKAIQQLFFWVTPLIVIAAVLATPLFRFVLTDKWLPAVPFFQMLCVFAIFDPVCSFNMDIVKVKGRSDLYLKLNIAVKISVIVTLAIAIPFGIYAIVASRVVVVFIRYFINSFYSGRYINYPPKQQLLDILPILYLNIAVGILAFIIYYYLNFIGDLWIIIIGFSSGGLFYWLIAKVLHLEAYLEFKAIILSKYTGYLTKIL
jgi:O-antigen/teichoic acid export membrane protein